MAHSSVDVEENRPGQQLLCELRGAVRSCPGLGEEGPFPRCPLPFYTHCDNPRGTLPESHLQKPVSFSPISMASLGHLSSGSLIHAGTTFYLTEVSFKNFI